MRAALLLLICWSLMGAMCAQRDDPPSAVEIRTAVPIPCQVDEPQCPAPAYDTARKDQPADQKAKLLASEAIGQADCLRRYREALASCRAAPGPEIPPIPGR